MKKKIVGILVCTLLITTALLAVGNMNVSNTSVVGETLGSGNKCAFSGSGDNLDNWAYTLSIDLTTATTAELKFWTQYDIDGSDYGYILVSPDDGGTWLTLDTLQGSQPDWIEMEFDLSALVGENIRIGLQYSTGSSSTSQGWHVDSIIVSGGDDCFYTEDFEDYEVGESWGDWTIVEKSGPPPIFIAHCMTPEGDPYPFDVIISDGEWRQEYEDVIYIETDVPFDATYTYIYEKEGQTIKNQFALNLRPGDINELEFFAIGPDLLMVPYTPYVFFASKGANKNLTSQWYSENNTLFYETHQEIGEIIDVGVLVDDYVNGEPLCYMSYEFEDIWLEPSTYSCSWGNSGRNFISIYELFGEIHIDIFLWSGAIDLRNVLYNDSRISFDMNLTGVNGTPYESKYDAPQYIVPDGNYLLSISDMPKEFPEKICIPIFAANRKTECFDVYALKKETLQYFTFDVLAEFPLAYSSWSNLTHDENENILSMDVVTGFDADWWGCFVLPNTEAVKKLTAYVNETPSELDIWYDYTINRVDEYNFVVVRIEPDVTSLKLEYIENIPPDKPTIDGPTSGKAGTSYTYTFTSTDPDGDDVSYYIKWGDATTTWTAFQASGTSYSESHTWSAEDTYFIEAKAKDTDGAESDWATLSVTMPKSKPYINTPFLNFLQQHPLIYQLLQQLLKL